MNSKAEKVLGHILRVFVYIMAGFGVYQFIHSGIFVAILLGLIGSVEGYLLRSKSE